MNAIHNHMRLKCNEISTNRIINEREMENFKTHKHRAQCNKEKKKWRKFSISTCLDFDWSLRYIPFFIFIDLWKIWNQSRFHPAQAVPNNGLTIRIWIEVTDTAVWFLLCRKILLLIFFSREKRNRKKTNREIY